MNEMQTLANIERRINYHMQSAYANVIEVGRCLIEAKESGLVPHGQWEAWVNRVANMNERTAQRLMKAAREVSPDSALAKLPISKIQAILALPEPQREEVAVKAVEENQSLRELQATIDAMRGDLEDARQKVQRVERERDDALTINNRIYKERAQIAKERDQAKQDYIAAGTAHSKAQDEVVKLTRQLDKAKRDLEKAKAAPATGISEEAQARIDQLTAQLADAEQMAEYQAQQRQQAQAELLDLRTQVARGEGAGRDDVTADSIVEMVRTFIGSAGYIPHFKQLATLSGAERQLVTSHVDMIADWVAAVREAMDPANVIVVEEV